MASKLNNDDRAWITGEIARQSSGLEGRLKEVENTIRLEEPWLKKQGYWFWPVLTIVLTSGLIGSVIHWSSWFFGDFVDHRIEAL